MVEYSGVNVTFDDQSKWQKTHPLELKGFNRKFLIRNIGATRLENSKERIRTLILFSEIN